MKEKDNLEDKIKSYFKENRLLIVKEVAELLHISCFSVRSLVKKGKLPAVKVLSKLRFDRTSIEQYLKNPKIIEKSPKVLRSICLEKSQLERLDILSAESGIPKAVYIREAIDLILGKYEHLLNDRQKNEKDDN